MGNWRIVEMTGTCPEDEVNPLRDACEIEYPKFTVEEWHDIDLNGSRPIDPHCLSWTKKGSLCGIERWVRPTINACGNVGKDVHEGEVAETLEDLAKIAPGLSLTVHMGGDYESEECVSTLILQDGKVTRISPQVSTVKGVPDQEMDLRFKHAMNMD